MTKDQVVKLRNQADSYSNGLIIVMDNMQLFSTKASDEFIIWNDDDEIITCIRANVDPMSQMGSPIEIMSSNYDHIQYMNTYTNATQAKEVIKGYTDGGYMDADEAEKANKFVDSLQNFTL